MREEHETGRPQTVADSTALGTRSRRITGPAATRRRTRWMLGIALAATLAQVPAARADACGDGCQVRSQDVEGAGAPAINADISPGQLGWLRLRVTAPPGATVIVQEAVPGGPTSELTRFVMEGPASGRAHLTAWRCDRRERRFTVRVEGSGQGTRTVPIAVTTPSCSGRVALQVTPRQATANRRFTIRTRDRWGTGQLPLDVCVQTPTAVQTRCRHTDLTATDPAQSLSVRTPLTGRYLVEVRGGTDVQMQRTVTVRPGPAGLRLLATGDSEIQILDLQLADRLRSRGVRVQSDAHVGSGIAKLFQLNWLQHAATSARTIRPDMTVVFLGANDGYGIGSQACCGPGWSRAYALRAEQMMRSYTRDGTARVYWFLLPTPRPAGYQEIFTGVNRALRLAAPRVPGVRLIDLSPTITPGGAFHQTVSSHGRTVNVRQSDGIHLSIGGDRIAVDVLIDAMRADGAL